MPVTVCIFEDNKAFRGSLEELFSFSDDFVVTGSFDSYQHASGEVQSGNPDVILMDIDMPGVSGIEAVRQIRGFNKKVAIIMLTVFDDNSHVLDAIFAGASGYLLKKHVAEKLITSIREVLDGGAPMSPAIAKMVLQCMQPSQGEPPDYGFTPREKDILQLLCKGNSYKMMAAETGLSFETIRSHIKHIYEKLQVHSATEAVSKAINERLV